ncbi:MAG: SpoIID/LytB domain-containing protein [Chlamydiota bacterium]
MKLFSYLIMVFLGCIAYAETATSGNATIPVRPENIHILLERDTPEALLEVKGPYYIFNPYNNSRLTSGLLGKRFIIRAIDDGIRWGEEFPGINQISIVPRSTETSFLVNGIQYAGNLTIYKVGNKLHIINDVPIEAFLQATLCSQFPYPLDNEVMSAIAIAARTTAYSIVQKNKNTFWHISAKDVAYQGCVLVSSDSPMVHAIDTTRNLILVNSEDKKSSPFHAVWTEHSAGKTAPYHAIFRKDELAPKEGAEAPHAFLDREKSKWTYSISKKDLASLCSVKKLFAIELFLDSYSKKTYAVRLQENKKDHLDMDFFQFQKVLGAEHILSNDFSVSVKKDQVKFTGYGKGHGVGICLYTAAAMAQNGDNAVKILTKFFPNTYLWNVTTAPQGEIAKK